MSHGRDAGLGGGDLGVDLVVNPVQQFVGVIDHATGVLRENLDMQGAVGADDLADPAEVRVEVNLALGLEDRGVGGHTGDGVDRGEPLDVVKVGCVEQDVHGAHPNAGPSPLHPLFSSAV